LLYQLPTGGGKTVVFSEIVRRYLSKSESSRFDTELSCVNKRQRLKGFGVKNKIINSKVKTFQNEYSCFVAMVETLKTVSMMRNYT
jgi:hypothetical protein